MLAAIGLTVALVGRVFVPRRGSTLFIGVIAMLLKLFSLGGVIIGPMVGIFTEALVAEIVLSLAGKAAPRRFRPGRRTGGGLGAGAALCHRPAALRADAVHRLAGPARPGQAVAGNAMHPQPSGSSWSLLAIYLADWRSGRLAELGYCSLAANPPGTVCPGIHLS